MFADPISLTIDTIPVNLPRISMGDMTAKYRSADGAYELNIAHSANKRERSVVRVTTNKVGSDPFDSAKSRGYTMQAYLVIDAPLNGVGFTDAEQEALIEGLTTFLSDSGNLSKVLGKES